MDVANVTETCRLCPSSGGGHDLLNVFDTSISFKYNIREAILSFTGIEILETDLVTKKICKRCCSILYKMYDYRLDAMKQDRNLKDKCGYYLDVKGLRLPNTTVKIKKENSVLTNKILKKEPEVPQPSTSSTPSSRDDSQKKLHASVANIFRKYPNFKLPKKCFERHMAPVVSLQMGDVESYFQRRKLNMKNFVYKPAAKTITFPKVARKRTSALAKPKTVAPLKISRKLLEKPETSVDKNYICMPVPKNGKERKRKISSGEGEVSDRSVDSKLSRNILPEPLSTSKSNAKVSKPANNKIDARLQANKMTPINDKPGTSRTVGTSSPMPAGPLFEESRTNTNEINARLKANKMLPKLDFKSINNKPGTSRSVRTPSPVPVGPLSENSGSPSPIPPEPLSEDSRDSCSTIISEATTEITSKPQFMDSFGLIPTVTATKSYTLLVCNLCGSVHHNSFELKRHISKHMVCQFCKIRFKSIESKQKHIDHSCLIKKVMNSSGPTVRLEKIHLNLNVRKKYSQAFRSFASIPGLIEPEPIPVEQVIIKEASHIPADAVIVLSDDEDETPTGSPDPLEGISPPSAAMSPPSAANVGYSTVSIVKPDIRIKHNTILNSLIENMTDKQLLKDLIELLRPAQPTTVETMLQTDLPVNRDIQINHVEGTCEFKNLKGQLDTYKIPVTVSNGPFNISYNYKNVSTTNKQMAIWDDLPVIGVPKKTVSQLKRDNLSKSASVSSLGETSKDQSFGVTVSSVPVMSHITTNSAIILPSAPTVTAVNGNCYELINVQTPLNGSLDGCNLTIPISTADIIPINTSNSATPLLQNYALSMTSVSVNNNPIPIPRTYINSALSKTVSTTSSRTMPSVIGNNYIYRPHQSSVTTTYNRPMPTSSLGSVSQPGSILVLNRLNALNTSSIPTVLNQPSAYPSIPISPSNTSSVHAVVSPPSAYSSVPINNFLSPTATVALTTSSSTASTSGTSSNISPAVPEVSKFRVKSVWELQ